MTVNELIKMLETAKQLGHGDSRICINDSRDGVNSFPDAKAVFMDTGSQMDPCKILTFGYA